MNKEYEKSIDFWNESQASKPEDYEGEIDVNEDWKQIGSESLLKLMSEAVKNWENVLDYGCGSGWAEPVLVKNGVKTIKAVDVAANAVKSAGYYAKAFKVADEIDFEAVSLDWLVNQPKEQYDHAICCNVLDVVPDDISKDIIKNLACACKKGATLLVTMNPNFPKETGEREGFEFKGSLLFVNGVLRVNCHSDEEWSDMFKEYFNVDRLEHFRWDVEQSDNRRLFYLTRK